MATARKGVTATNYRDIIQQSLDYIEDNLKTEITAAELAQQAGFSLYHFYRLFQDATGLPVKQYILRRRLLHGVYAISRGSTAIEAALNYGFDTYAGFYRAFLREFGATPSGFLDSGRARRPYRLNLSKEEHMTVTHKKAAAILKAWQLEHEPITDVYRDSGDKYDNIFYIGTEYVLKFTANPGKLTTDIALSHALGHGGLCTTLPVPTADGREYLQDGDLYFYLTRRVPGTPLSPSAIYQEPDTPLALGEAIGQLDLALEGLNVTVNDGSLLDTVRNWALPAARTALNLPDTFCRHYLEKLERLLPALPCQIIHRDPNPGNIIRNGNKLGFMDFELSQRNVRIYDPCYAATAILSEGFNEHKEHWLEIFRQMILGYDTAVHLTDFEWEAIPYVILANQLICVAWFADQEKYEQLLEINKRMTLWIVENLDKMYIRK